MPYKIIGCLQKQISNDMLIKKEKMYQRYKDKMAQRNIEQNPGSKKIEQIHPLPNKKPKLDDENIYPIYKEDQSRASRLLKSLKESQKLLENYIREYNDMDIYNPANNDEYVKVYVPKNRI